MQLLDVARKDLLQSTRNMMALVFMFVVPILVTVLFRLMFGGLASGGDEGFHLPRTEVILVNLDQGQLPAGALPAGGDLALASGQSLGSLLVQVLGSETFADLLNLTDAPDAAAARAAVDAQQAGVAVIIPADFSRSLLETGATSSVELYQDPTLTLGPTIVESIIRRLVDGFAAGKIAVEVTLDQLQASDMAVSPQVIQQVVAQASRPSTLETLLVVESPSGAEQVGVLASILSLILGGMMVFYAFFTGAASLQSILTEEERGTLSRLFTTPTSRRSILGGKALATVVMLLVQVVVLLLFGNLVFGIDWGPPASVFLAGSGLVMISVATGLFVVSLLENTRQAGVLFGGVLTLTGMIGLISVFTGGAPLPPAVRAASLLVPQGWAMRALQTAIDGGTVAEVMPTLAVMLVWTVVFGAVGVLRLQRRFA